MEYSVESLQEYIASIPPYPGTFKGRGIVISAGGPYLASAYIAVRSLRHQGCTLPIQIWHMGSGELPQIIRPIFERLDTVCVDAFEIRKIHPFKNLGGWQNKIFSMVYSPFQEVFSFDADNVALQNPEALFSDPSYLESGQIFWPDFFFEQENIWAIKSFAWSFLGLPPRKGAELETGQVIVNKAKCWKALHTAMHMNEESEFYYNKCTYGDTGTYRLAWEYLGLTPNVVSTRPKLLEDMVRIHYTTNGEPLFQHCRKWILPSEKNPHRESFVMEKLCFEWLAQFESEVQAIGISLA